MLVRYPTRHAQTITLVSLPPLQSSETRGTKQSVLSTLTDTEAFFFFNRGR